MVKRRSDERGRLSAYSGPLYAALRASADKAGTLLGAVGIFLAAGLVVAALGTWIFVELAEHVQMGASQAFDDAVLRWLGAHHSTAWDNIMLEITALGTGTVVMMIVAVAALFLWHTQHKHSARLLLAAVAGNIILNGVLKLVFHRDRPTVFEWQTTAVSSSFPSGHAMS
ncbi:MAG TPA: phosphatase PAP2 family protein, partial [Gemmatimonadaceae bacterium]